MRKKNVLHIIQSLDNGGCENMLLRTLPLLDDFEHKIITLKTLGELAPKFVSSGIAIETIHCDNIFNIPGILRLRKIVKEENPDIIITYLFHADMIGRLALPATAKVPIIPFLRTTYNHPKYLIARFLEWLTKGLVSQYLANSEAVKDFYIEHIGVRAEKITIIPNGIDTEYFNAITTDPKLKESLGIRPDDIVVICVANLYGNKGHRYLLEAVEKTYKRNTHVKLLLVGDGEEKKNLKRQIANYSSRNNISFLGRRTDVPRLLKISDIFILPTLFEGMSNAIMEAMSCGLPVIASAIDENKRLIENNQTGILVTVKESQAIYLAIETVLGNPELKRALSGNARLFIGKNYSLGKVVDAWRSFLNNRT